MSPACFAFVVVLAVLAFAAGAVSMAAIIASCYVSGSLAAHDEDQRE